MARSKGRGRDVQTDEYTDYEVPEGEQIPGEGELRELVSEAPEGKDGNGQAPAVFWDFEKTVEFYQAALKRRKSLESMLADDEAWAKYVETQRANKVKQLEEYSKAADEWKANVQASMNGEALPFPDAKRRKTSAESSESDEG
jgi:hypothetical protein